jgi:glycosyltransferase involved in cell wall biosynthesis
MIQGQTLDIANEVRRLYAERRQKVVDAAAAGDAEACIRLAEELLTFMNRFRNCNLESYFDEELHRALLELNKRRFDTSHLLKAKSEFRIAFVFDRFNDTGGAAFTHRYMLERYLGDVSFKQYVLITNRANEKDYRQRERYQYMRDNIEVEEFLFLEPNASAVAKAEQAQQWLYDRQIDFAVFQPSPLSMYVLASQPVLLSATFSADCHVFTLGPGTGDFTFYLENDQVYKYRYSDPAYDERRIKTVLLPLPPQKYIDASEPMPRAELGLPEDAVVSATTNIWKCTFGDTDILLQGIAALMRRFPNYHHIFLGTPRGSDSLEFFLNKNPDLKERIRFVGAHPQIYRVLKSIDFYVNSFPVSGATNTEIAILGKPSIDLLSHRDMSFHNTEFLRSNECAVCSLDELVTLGTRFIGDPAYRDELGAWLRERVARDLDKGWLAGERIYGAFLDEFRRRLGRRDRLPALGVDRTIEMEKRIAFYSAHARGAWGDEDRWRLLAACRSDFSDRPFGWVAGLEEVVRTGRDDRFSEIVAALPESLLLDTRIQVMLALAHRAFGRGREAIAHAETATKLAIYDKVPARVLARLYLQAGDAGAAVAALSHHGREAVSADAAAQLVAGLPRDELPIYYNF